MKYALLIILLLFCPVWAQRAAKHDNDDASSKSKKEEAASAPILTLAKLNNGQKAHLKLYYQEKQLKLSGKYSLEKTFVPIYSPFYDFTVQLGPEAKRALEQLEQKIEELRQANKIVLLAKAEKRVELFTVLHNLCQDAQRAYKKKHPNELKTLMNRYTDFERQLLDERIKIPKREWISASEAGLLLQEYSRKQGK